MEDDRSRIRNELKARSAAAYGADGSRSTCDVRVALNIGALQPLVCRITGDGVAFDDSLPAEATFRFDCEATALALLGGDGDFFEAFMAERVRADGHITLAFTLMAAFGKGSAQAPP